MRQCTWNIRSLTKVNKRPVTLSVDKSLSAPWTESVRPSDHSFSPEPTCLLIPFLLCLRCDYLSVPPSAMVQLSFTSWLHMSGITVYSLLCGFCHSAQPWSRDPPSLLQGAEIYLHCYVGLYCMTVFIILKATDEPWLF